MKKHILLTAIFLFLSVYDFANAACDERYKDKIFNNVLVFKDIRFGSNTGSLGDSMDLFLDVYTPPEEDTMPLRPLIVFVHGGAFVGGGKSAGTLKFMAKEMAQRGYVGVSVQYRLQETDKEGLDPLLMFADKTNWYKSIGRGVQDVKAAIRFIKKDVATNGNTYRIDTNNIILYGSSAGAITVLHSVYLTDLNHATNIMRISIEEIGGLEGNTGNPGYSATNTIRAVVSCSGALGNEDWIAHRKDVAYLAFHHTNDPAVPFKNGCFYTAFCHLGRFDGDFRLTNKAAELGVNVEMNIFEGSYHPADDLQPEVVRDSMVSFLYALQCAYDPSLAPVATAVQPQLSLNINAFPNPNTGNFSINVPTVWSGKECNIEIYRLDGQLATSQRVLVSSSEIVLNTLLENGIYLLKCSMLSDVAISPLLAKISILH